jgi:hypothetical protein
MRRNFKPPERKGGDTRRVFIMKNTIKFLGIIALAAIIAFSFTACPDNGGGGGGGGGGKVPAALQGNWSTPLGANTLYLFFNADGWAESQTAFPTSITYKVTSVSGNTVNWEHAQYGDPPSGSFDYAITGNTLTISNSTRSSTQGPYNGTYTKQGTSGGTDITYTVTPTGSPDTTAINFTYLSY